MASKKAPYFGRNKLWWCAHCGLPLVRSNCDSCGGGGEKIRLTPPQDARPAFEKNVELINQMSEKQFGAKFIPQDCVVVLNRIPAKDHAEEIICQGRIVGRAFHDMITGWTLKPTVAGVNIMLSQGMSLQKKIVRTEDEIFRFFDKGDMLAPGVTRADPEIKAGEQVIVLSKNRIACGMAKKSGTEMVREGEKGIAVKIRDHGPKEHLELKESNWSSAVSANDHALKGIEQEACNFVKRIVERERGHRPLVVSFSGGKDSLAVFLIAKEALGSDGLKLMFADTGLEFPETLAFIERVKSDNPECEFLIDHASKDAFWKALPIFGMPTRSYRWCCKVCKLSPMSRIVSRNFPNTGCVSLMGERRYESHDRARRPRIDVNQWITQQVHAYPIIEWNALEVWLYTFWKGADYNPLYEEGFSRIGCWLCPAADPAEGELIRKLHPDLVARLEGCLANKTVLPRTTPEMRHGTDKSGNFVFEADFGDCIIDLERIRNVCPWSESVLGDGVLKIQEIASACEAVLFPSGKLKVTGKQRSDVSKLFDALTFAIVRVRFCVGCGLCVNNCPAGAISVQQDEGDFSFTPVVDTSRCTNCGLCAVPKKMKCPAWLLFSRKP